VGRVAHNEKNSYRVSVGRNLMKQTTKKTYGSRWEDNIKRIKSCGGSWIFGKSMNPWCSGFKKFISTTALKNATECH
jgi:hypothetical protein